MTEQASHDSDQQGGDASLARPYAKAIFELAKARDTLTQWSDRLDYMAAVARDNTLRAALDNPSLTRHDAAELFIRACGDEIGDEESNLLRILAENDRIDQLPMIAAEFRRLRDEAEGTIEADVISALPLSEAQKTAIANALKKRLGRDVQLNCSVDEELVGGAVIRAGDLVIDGSAVEHLRQLSSTLVH